MKKTPPTTQGRSNEKVFQVVVGHLAKVEESEQYKKLTPDNQVKMRGYLYDKYVTPVFAKRGLKPPPKDQWITKQYKATNWTEYLPHPTEQAMSMIKGMSDVAVGGLSFSEWASKKALGDEGFGLLTDKQLDTAYARTKQPFQWLHDRAGTYIGDHGSQNLTRRFYRFVAEEAPKLALYEAAGTTVNAASSAAGIDELIGKGLVAPKVLKIAKNAAEGFIIGKGLNESNEQAKKDAELFAAFGLPGLGADVAKVGLKQAASSNKEIEKFFSKLMAVGGRNFVYYTMNEGQRKAWATVSSSKPAVSSEAIDAINKYLSRNNRFATLPKAITGKTETLPRTAREKLGEAGFKILNDVSKKNHGKLYQFLNETQREKVFAQVLKHVDNANETIVSSAPMTVATTIKEDITKQAQRNPFFNKAIQMMKSAGADVERDNFDATVEHNAIVTEKKSIPKVLEKLTQKEVELPQAREERKARAFVDSLNSMGEGPGAAHYNSPEFESNLLNLVKSNFTLESPDHQLTMLWGLRTQFPKPIKMQIEQMMKRRFKPVNGFSARDYNQMVRRLEEHMRGVGIGFDEKIPEITRHGAKVFRSTETIPGVPDTPWQADITKLLEDE